MRSGLPAALSAALVMFAVSAAADPPAVGPDSHLPVPRFASLKAEGANGRRGPGLEHRIDWIYQRAGLPLQITGESGPWRRVRDPDGDQVWMHAQNLDNRRTVYVTGPAVLRRTAEGWRDIHWAESPMTGVMYLQKLMERDVVQEKFKPCHEKSMERWRKS